MDEKIIKNILARIEKLERAVFIAQKKPVLPKPLEKYEGPKGGVILLISHGYFNKRKTAFEVKEELEKKGYDYRIQVVQTALNRLSKSKGPLTTQQKNGKKVYAKRK